MKRLTLSLGERSYDITVGRGLLSSAREIMGFRGKCFIVTDDGVPREYSEKVREQCKESVIYTVKSGEGAKSFEVLEKLLGEMLRLGLGRSDSVIAVGGGVVGDLAGFAASIYMRGIAFYNIPTTLLSEVDSSIGGKCAVNFGGVKNIIGSFHQPKAVLIDTDTLHTLPKRQLNAGLCESVKMALTSDAELFRIFEENEVLDDTLIDEIVVRSLMIKKNVVEADEFESGLRRILNFGHTFGHGIEACEGLSGLYHGECVALGMLPMCSKDVRDRLIPVLKKLKLPTSYTGNTENALGYVTHDKKCDGGSIEVIFVDRIGDCRREKMPLSEYTRLIREAL